MEDHPGQTTALQTIVQAMRGAIEDGNDSTKLTQALTENQRLNQLIEKEHAEVLELQKQVEELTKSNEEMFDELYNPDNNCNAQEDGENEKRKEPTASISSGNGSSPSSGSSSDSDEENDSPTNPRNLIVSDTYDNQIEHVQPEQSQSQRRSERLSSRSTTQSSHYDTARSSGSVQKRRSTPTDHSKVAR